MTRPLRIEFPGAWYHVMNRGLARTRVFRRRRDYLEFLQLLNDAWARWGVEIHAYCLMPNHYHLLARTPEPNLGRVMRHINGLYTQTYNRARNRDGPIFRGRYKAVLVQAEVYWTWLSRYVHRNPLEAGLVENLDDYSWSSFGNYVRKNEEIPDWLYTGRVLENFRSRRAYRGFVERSEADGDPEPDYGKAGLPAILGDKAFRAEVGQSVEVDPEIPAIDRLNPRPDFDSILAATADYYGISRKFLLQSTRGRGVQSPARSLAMYICQEKGDMRLAEIARKFGLSGYASAGATIRNVRRRLEDEAELAEDLNYILQDLTPLVRG